MHTHACTYPRARTHMHRNMSYFLHFHDNNGYANASRCYVIRTCLSWSVGPPVWFLAGAVHLFLVGTMQGCCQALKQTELEAEFKNLGRSKILCQELEGSRRGGRPRKRWKEEAEREWGDGESWRQIGKSGQSPQRAVVHHLCCTPYTFLSCTGDTLAFLQGNWTII